MSKKIIAILCSLALCITSVFSLAFFNVKADSEKEVFCAYEFDGTNKVSKEDLDEYSLQAKMEAEGQTIEEGEDYTYTYLPTTGKGVLEASVTGTNLKHLSWSKDLYNDTDGDEMTILSPIINASASNPWSANCYVSIKFDSSNYEEAEGSLQLACSKKGPCNFVITYLEQDNGVDTYKTLAEVTLATNKQFTNVSFDLPKELCNNENAEIFIQLADTTAYNGTVLTDEANRESGEFALNNIVFSGKKIAEESGEPTTEQVTDDATTELVTDEPTTELATDAPTEVTTGDNSDATEVSTEATTEVASTTAVETTIPVVKLDTPTGLAVGETDSAYFVKWNKVNNAEGYFLSIYEGDKLLYELPTAENYMEVSKLLISGLVDLKGTYTIEVVAFNNTINGISDSSKVSYTFGAKEETTTAKKSDDVKVAKAVIKKVYAKKKAAKKLKLKIKAVPKYNNAYSYEYLVKVYKTKKNAKKDKKALVSKQTSKANCTISSKKLKNKKTLFVKVRYVVTFNMPKNESKDSVPTVLPQKMGAWSAIKKVKIKK